MTASINLYSIRDVQIGHFCPPFLAHSDNEAKSVVRDAMEVNSILARFPRDYQLYRIGVMTEAEGLTDNTKECVCSVYDIARREVLDETASTEGGADCE